MAAVIVAVTPGGVLWPAASVAHSQGVCFSKLVGLGFEALFSLLTFMANPLALVLSCLSKWSLVSFFSSQSKCSVF